MTRRLVGLTVLLLTVLLVQTTVLPVLLRPGFLPDLATVLAVLVTLERGPRAGLWMAGAGGLLADLLATSAPLGGGIAVAAAVATGVGLLRPYLGDRGGAAAVPLAGLGAALAFLLAAVLRVLLASEPVLSAPMLAAGVVATGALGAVIAVPLQLLLRRIAAPDPDPLGVGSVA